MLVETGGFKRYGSSPKVFFTKTKGPIFGTAFVTFNGVDIVAALKLDVASWETEIIVVPAPTIVILPVVAPTVATVGSDDAYTNGEFEFEVGSLATNGASPNATGSRMNLVI